MSRESPHTRAMTTKKRSKRWAMPPSGIYESFAASNNGLDAHAGAGPGNRLKVCLLSSWLWLPLMRITLASTLATVVATASALPSVEIQAASWIVVDGESGEILGEHNPTQSANQLRSPTYDCVCRAWRAKARFAAMGRGSDRQSFRY